jgi:integrase/recombinase XerD
MARIYVRRKEPGKGWRYKAIPSGGGRRPVFDSEAKFHVRYPDTSGKFVYSEAYDTLEEAQQAAAELPTIAKAVAAGVTLQEYKDRENAHRIPIKKAVDDFLAHARKTKKPKTVAGYKLNLGQFVKSIDKVHFLDEVGKTQLYAFRDFLAGEGYEARTLHNRMMTVLSLLKTNRIKADFSLGKDLPEFEEEPAVPYEPAELRKLFGEMKPEEVIRYKFFLGTACRDKEVTYASWQDIDFARGIYHIRRKPDIGFTPKRHESRDVKMPTDLVTALKERKKDAPHPRWIFVNDEGRPDNHFLRKFKRIALRAKVNCGQCTAPWTAGRYHTTRKIQVTCETHPVCQHHYLHRLRKTCASNWEAKGVPVRTIQYMLGHKSLETTQNYLGITNLDSLTDKIDAAAVIV